VTRGTINSEYQLTLVSLKQFHAVIQLVANVIIAMYEIEVLKLQTVE
jgi:hypothetical protein